MFSVLCNSSLQEDSVSVHVFLHSFLPNYVSHKDTYQQKAFCGVYSEDGNMFLSACQGK